MHIILNKNLPRPVLHFIQDDGIGTFAKTPTCLICREIPDISEGSGLHNIIPPWRHSINLQRSQHNKNIRPLNNVPAHIMQINTTSVFALDETGSSAEY